MSFDFDVVNLWAALTAGVASFVIGGVWYAALFGKAWARAYSFSEDEIRAMGAHPERTFPLMLVCEVIVGFGVALIAANMEITSAGAGAALGAALWVGVAAPLALATQIGSGRSLRGWAIDSGKHLASLLAIGVIVGAWR